MAGPFMRYSPVGCPLTADKPLLSPEKISFFPRRSFQLIALIFFLAVLEAGFLAFLPFGFGRALNRALSAAVRGPVRDVLLLPVGRLLLALILISGLGVLRDYLYAGFRGRALMNLRQTLFERLQRMPMAFHAGPESLHLKEEIAASTGVVAAAAAGGISRGLLPFLEALFFTFLIVWTHFAAGIVAVSYWLWTLLAPRAFARREGADATAGTEALDLIDETVRAQPLIRAFGLEPMFAASFRRAGGGYLRAVSRAGFASALASRVPLLGILILHIVTAVMSFFFLFTRAITLANMISLIILTLLLSAALSRLSGWLLLLSKARIALRDIRSRFNDPDTVLDAPDAEVFTGLRREILFDNVQGGITARIPCGQYAAFVGASGSGKTILLNLLLRFENPSSGAIFLDGTPIENFTQASLRSRMGLVAQDHSIFDISLLANIRLGSQDASAESIVGAAGAAGLEPLIARLPRGYETPAGVDGSQLSAEVRQRLALARALLRDPSVLLLDEIGYELDPAREAALQETLRRVTAGRTVIAAASRLACVAGADRIFVLSDGVLSEGGLSDGGLNEGGLSGGRLIAQGTHESLLASCPYYAELWQKQSGFRFSADGRHVDVEPERLQLLPDFEDLPWPCLTELAKCFATEHFPSGRTILVEGDPTDKLYILVRGTVEAWIGEEEAVVMQDGDYFGASMGTVRTLSACTCISLERYHFQRVTSSASAFEAAAD